MPLLSKEGISIWTDPIDHDIITIHSYRVKQLEDSLRVAAQRLAAWCIVGDFIRNNFTTSCYNTCPFKKDGKVLCRNITVADWENFLKSGKDLNAVSIRELWENHQKFLEEENSKPEAKSMNANESDDLFDNVL